MCIAIRKHSIGCCYKVTNIPTLSVDCLKPHSVSLYLMIYPLLNVLYFKHECVYMRQLVQRMETEYSRFIQGFSVLVLSCNYTCLGTDVTFSNNI